MYEKFIWEEINNITGISVKTLYRASKKFEEH